MHYENPVVRDYGTLIELVETVGLDDSENLLYIAECEWMEEATAAAA